MELTNEQALAEAKKRGLVPNDTKTPTVSKEAIFKIAIKRGLIKPREDGAGFLTRTKFSFADSDLGRKQVLEEEYGKGRAMKMGDRWLINDKKGWNYVDEDSLSWNDVGDLIGELPEVATATVGGAAGTIAGSGGASVPLGIAGATVGGAGGRGIKKLIARALGIKDSQTATEITQDMLESGLWGGAGQGAGLVLGKVLNKSLSPFKNKMTSSAQGRETLANK